MTYSANLYADPSFWTQNTALGGSIECPPNYEIEFQSSLFFALGAY